jgi:hypothetical protein
MPPARKSRSLAAAGAFLLVGAFLLAAAMPCAATTIPEGTVLPVRLNSTLSSKKSKPGQIVTARIMQEVPLPGGAKIRPGTTVVGHVTSVTPASGETGGSIALRFEFVRMPHEHIALSTHLRAIASFMTVQRAQVPLTGGDRASQNVWTTVQIGGEVVYRGGGHVESKTGRVGEPVPDGVLGRLRANPDAGCSAGDPNDLPQALWLFSTNACGPYDLPDLIIAHAGRTPPAGEITLRSKKGNVDVNSGGGLLLRVNGSDEPQS